jgi:hypothetical protein
MARYLHVRVHEMLFDCRVIIASAVTAAPADGPHVNLMFLF